MESADGAEEHHKNTVIYSVPRPALGALTRKPPCWIQYRNKGPRLLDEQHFETQLCDCLRLTNPSRTSPAFAQLLRSQSRVPGCKWHYLRSLFKSPGAMFLTLVAESQKIINAGCFLWYNVRTKLRRNPLVERSTE
jgi:hypothetical protein